MESTQSIAGVPEAAIQSRRPNLSQILPVLILVLAAIAISLPSLGSSRIDDIDSAHHITDGLFFRDVVVDLPHSLQHPIAYTLSYYRQYPALGFIFWPPFFPMVEGAFFLVGPLDVPTARACILAFGIVFALFLYRICRRYFPVPLSLLAVLVLLITPLILEFYQQVMLEIPALAMVALTIYAYQRVVDREAARWADLAMFVGFGVAAVYTKQPTVFIFAAMLCDVLANHRSILRERRVWVAMILLALLLAPLAIYTLSVGQANLQQSFGSDKTYVMNSVAPPDRWSLAGWFYYPRRLPVLLNSIWLVLGTGSVLYGIVKRDFLRRYALWFGWLGSWYFLFSYFLNKQDRYALFWLPAWVVLAVGLLLELNKTYSWRQGTVYLILAIPCLASAAKVRMPVIDGFDGVDSMVKEVIARRSEGNILYVGERHQIVVPFVRMYDSSRSIQVLRGSDLLGPADDAADVCREYRVRFIVAERDRKTGLESFGGGANFNKLGAFRIATRYEPLWLDVFQYNGPIAATQRQIQLGKNKIGAGATRILK